MNALSLVTATRDPADATAIYEALIELQNAANEADEARVLAERWMTRTAMAAEDAADWALIEAERALAAQLRLAGINPEILPCFPKERR